MKKYKIVYSDEFKKQLGSLPPEIIKEVEAGIKIVSRNPYVGDEIGVGLVTKIKNKILWLKREMVIWLK